MALIVSAAMGSGAASAVDPPMTFQTTGSLCEVTAQVSVIATPIGRVVIGEGWRADVFEATTNSWLPTIPFHGDHWTVGAALLPDGPVLVAGTANTTAGAVSAEVLDPIAGTSTPTGAMGTPCSDDYEGAMPDGRMFVWAGFKARTSGSPITTAETYNPASNALASADSPLPARWNATLTCLADGRYLVVGGSDAAVRAVGRRRLRPRRRLWDHVAYHHRKHRACARAGFHALVG